MNLYISPFASILSYIYMCGSGSTTLAESSRHAWRILIKWTPTVAGPDASLWFYVNYYLFQIRRRFKNGNVCHHWRSHLREIWPRQSPPQLFCWSRNRNFLTLAPHSNIAQWTIPPLRVPVISRRCWYQVCWAVLWIRIRIGSVFRSFVDPDPYSEYGSRSTHVKIG